MIDFRKALMELRGERHFGVYEFNRKLRMANLEKVMAGEKITNEGSVKTVADLMAEEADTGIQDFDAQDFVAPWLVICQTNSPYIDRENPLFIPDMARSYQGDEGETCYEPLARPGRIINVKTMEVYRQAHVIPIRYEFRNVEWVPRSKGGGFVSSYDRKHSPNDLTSDEIQRKTIRISTGNIIEGTGYWLCLLEEAGWDMCIVPFKSTQLKVSKRWTSDIANFKQEANPDKLKPMYSQIWTLSTVGLSNNLGTWFGWQVEWSEEVKDVNLYLHCKEMRDKQIEFLPERVVAQIGESQREDNDVM